MRDWFTPGAPRFLRADSFSGPRSSKVGLASARNRATEYECPSAPAGVSPRLTTHQSSTGRGEGSPSRSRATAGVPHSTPGTASPLSQDARDTAIEIAVILLRAALGRRDRRDPGVVTTDQASMKTPHREPSTMGMGHVHRPGSGSGGCVPDLQGAS